MSDPQDPPNRHRAAVAAMTFATGAVVANLYYAQPLEAALAEAFHASTAAVGVVLTIVQVSYALGLATLVPLGDLRDRRRLTVVLLAVTVVGLVVAAVAPTLGVLAAGAAFFGVTSCAAQILVPFAAHLARPGEQGRTVSTVMSGLLVGVLLARVVAGLVAEAFGWRAVFALAAVLTAVSALALWKALPAVAPTTDLRYPRLLLSVLALVRDEPRLRLRMAYGAAVYAGFGAVWTSVGFLLAGEPFRLSEAVIGLFGLFGAAGALASRVSGRIADRGRVEGATGLLLALTAASFVAVALSAHSLVALAIGLVLFDFGVQGTQVLNLNVVYALRPDARSRLNTAYMTTFFVGGALGSGVSAVVYAAHGWTGVSVVGAAFPTVGLLVWLADRIVARRRVSARAGSPG